ncbi:MAG TPA: GNAT family N-acetyltransferase [Myxococcaceae bacterium]|nr:GNAT family N-acetyltransferase [Myxococcaceae bacterium]
MRFQVRVLSSISDVAPEEWDAVAGARAVPFIRWGWLHALEASNSAVAARGWEAAHLTCWRAERLVAAAPCWVKSHSMGEYIYDFGWADAARQIGVRYYPKLVIGVPLGPIASPKLLVREGEDADAARAALVSAARELAAERRCSSIHGLFLDEGEAAAMAAAGFTRRLTLQFHWSNPGYGSYEDFLSRFTSKRRHQLRRERAAATEQGVTIATIRGDALRAEHAERAWRFYEATNMKNPWGRVQLTRDFFTRAFKAFPQNVEVVEARRGDQVIAGAFNVASGDRLFGRYWGALEEVPFLHFNVCLYHSIDECIRLGKKVFEPGAGGEHKIARGFEPTAIHSAHLIFDKRLNRAIRAFCEEERAEHEALLARREEIAGLKPWTRDQAAPTAGR